MQTDQADIKWILPVIDPRVKPYNIPYVIVTQQFRGSDFTPCLPPPPLVPLKYAQTLQFSVIHLGGLTHGEFNATWLCSLFFNTFRQRWKFFYHMGLPPRVLALVNVQSVKKKKNRNTFTNSDTNYRREMKLVPINMDYCLH